MNNERNMGKGSLGPPGEAMGRAATVAGLTGGYLSINLKGSFGDDGMDRGASVKFQGARFA